MAKPLSVYIHIPFCEKKCDYCDFYSVIASDSEAISSYVDKLCDEITSSPVAHRKDIETIYIGGGTPSLLNEEQLEKIFAVLSKCDGEIAIEVNPNSVNLKKLTHYKRLGINRVSIGVQSFDDETLRELGRLHDSQQAIDCIMMAEQIFDDVSIDLIYGVNEKPIVIPDVVLPLVKHVSAYSLIIEKGTKFEARAELDEEVVISQQKQIQEQLKGFERYEVSNFARSGFESKHNMNYWRCGEWIGFGEGAKSSHDFDETDRIMMGLRTTEGIALDNPRVDELIKKGLLQRKGERVSCTDKGFLVLNQIILSLV